MANHIAFKLVKDTYLKDILLYTVVVSLALLVVINFINYIIEMPKLIKDIIFLMTMALISIYFVSYLIYTYGNLLKMHGTIFLQAENIKIIIEKEQYAFSLLETTSLFEYILPIENIIKIEILYLGHESLIAKSRSYEKRDGHKNTIYIQTKDNEYNYSFFSDEKRDKKYIAAYVIFWKRNYNVEIKWESLTVEQKDLDRLEEYAYS
jgi:hypothetical protein